MHAGGPLDAGVALGETVRRLSWQQLKLRVSVGVARNKLLAKLASANAKPDGLLTVADADVPALLASTPVTRLPGAPSDLVALQLPPRKLFLCHDPIPLSQLR